MSDSGPNRIAQICQRLLDNTPLNEDERYLTLDEFIDLYQCVAQRTAAIQDVHVVLLSKNAAVQFPRVSRQRLVVRHKHRLTKKDFSRTVVKANFFGDKLDYSLRIQLKEEKRNALILLVIFVAFLVSMIGIGLHPAADYNNYLADPSKYAPVGQALDALKTISELVVTSATLFLSIFLVFTVAQNVEMARDKFLFEEGLAHKYHRDDVFISKVALLSLFLGIANTVLLVIPVSLQLVTFTLGGITISLNKLSLWSPLAVALSATGLAMCFLSILYYFERVIGNIGAMMADSTLKEALENVAVESNSQGGSAGSDEDGDGNVPVTAELKQQRQSLEELQ